MLKNKEEQKKRFQDAALMIESNECARQKTKLLIYNRHVQNYFNKYAKPFTDDGKSLSYMLNEKRTPVKDRYGKPMYDDEIINRQKEAVKGTRNYLLCLFRFDVMIKATNTSTEWTRINRWRRS